MTRPPTVGAGRTSSMFIPRARTRRRMEPITPTGRGRGLSRREFGFTMVELMIVMAIIVILVSLAIPKYQKALIRAKESVLKSNLFTLRQVIDEYTYDKKKAPQSLQDLVARSEEHTSEL